MSNSWIYLVLFLAPLLTYLQVRHFDFVNFDDPEYVANNPHVRAGITPDSLKWALTSRDGANWFPVTRLSHILDAQLFGSNSGLDHLANVLFHALATLLLFAFLDRATRARWPSAFVAFVFALHPLHVESVAWISERKDVLCALFWFLTLWAYVRYTERPKSGSYLLAFACFGIGLLAKPMIVTLPFVLLLLDIWPLRRVSQGWKRLILEKVPFFALSLTAAVIAYLAQQGSGAVKPLPIGLRIENALVSYRIYIAKTFWPTRLAVFYPYPPAIAAWQALIAGLILLSISLIVLRLIRPYPYLAVGWLWYLVTLAPVIGVIQIGAQGRADRYMYVPIVGLLIMSAWGAADVLRHWPGAKLALTALTVAACTASITLTYFQIQYWRNSETLFQHALDSTHRNYLAHHNLGDYLLDVPGRLPEAVAHLQEAVRIRPDSSTAHTDLGNALSRMPGHLLEAVAEYRTALRINQDSAIPHNNLANALSKIPGRLPEAISEYKKALRIDPGYAEARNNLGSALAKTGQLAEAISEFGTALRLKPDYAEARANLAEALSRAPDRLPDAIAQYQAALRLEPHSADLHYNLGVALSKLGGQLPQAIQQFEAALEIRPDFADAHNNLGVALSQAGRVPEAIQHFEAALRIRPDYADAHFNLGVALSGMQGRLPEAIAQFEAVERLRPDPEIQQIIQRLRAAQR